MVDTNILLAVALNEPSKSHLVEITLAATAVAPDILPYEIGNALSAMVKRRRMTVATALSAQKAADSIPVRLVPADVHSSLQLACECDIYAYDAYFLQCARSYSLALLTLDRRMKQVARKLNLRVLE